jgi:hypothetical protein
LKPQHLRRELSKAAERDGATRRGWSGGACVLVSAGGRDEWGRDVAASRGERLADHQRELEAAGADEAILVVAPVTEASVREFAAALPS